MRQNKVTLENSTRGEVNKQNREKQYVFSIMRNYLNIKQLKQLKVDILGQTGNAVGMYLCMLYVYITYTVLHIKIYNSYTYSKETNII